MHQRSFHSAHTNPMDSGPINTFLARNQKNQKLRDFQPQKGGATFSTFFSPNPPSKKWVSSGGGPRGVPTKNSFYHWGMCLLDRIMILQGAKPTWGGVHE